MVFNHIQFNGYVNPYFYVLFIILLPFETPGWLLLVVAFLLGFSVDYISGTSGMHTMATVFMAFVRPFVLRGLAPRDGFEKGSFPRIHYMGIAWFAKYAILLILFHHLILFYIEIFRISDFFSTLFRVVLSTIFTFIFIIISQFFIFRK